MSISETLAKAAPRKPFNTSLTISAGPYAVRLKGCIVTTMADGVEVFSSPYPDEDTAYDAFRPWVETIKALHASLCPRAVTDGRVGL